MPENLLTIRRAPSNKRQIVWVRETATLSPSGCLPGWGQQIIFFEFLYSTEILAKKIRKLLLRKYLVFFPATFTLISTLKFEEQRAGQIVGTKKMIQTIYEWNAVTDAR